ncbi:MAG TPA: DedA family protein [Urbifossiella sp.]|jgi:membrane-associated protein|nr:DedA family protein [Urbifossiella sp.]
MPDIAGLVRDHGYWVLGLIVLLENAGLPVPGETVLLAAGYLTSPDGGHRLHFGAVAVVAFAAAVVGDNLGFWLGRRVARPRLDAGRRFLFLTPERMRLAERYFETYGVATVFFARFVTGLRVVAGPAAGASAMRWGRFLVANAAGAVCWAVAITFVGHYAGHAWEAMRDRLGRGAWVALAVGLVLFAAWRFVTYRRRRRALAPTQPV